MGGAQRLGRFTEETAMTMTDLKVIKANVAWPSQPTVSIRRTSSHARSTKQQIDSPRL